MRNSRAGLSGDRLALVRAAIWLVFIALGARAVHLSVFDDRGEQRGRAQTRRLLELPAERGAIHDRRGTELALSVGAPSVYAVAEAREAASDTARHLAPLLGIPVPTLEARLAKRRSFAFLARWVPKQTAEKIQALDLPGIGILYEPTRTYPHRDLAAAVLGFANIDGFGVRGIEQAEETWLRGKAHRVSVQKDARGRVLMSEVTRPHESSGGDIALTLDARMQADAESALFAGVQASGARSGVAISMDPHTGDILALAEMPSFDPNQFRHFEYSKTRSRAFLDSVEPGSTLKAFLVAAALEKGALEASDRFDCEEGAFRIPGKTIRDPHPHGDLGIADILRVSSNVGAVKIGYQLGKRDHYQMLRRFGFGESTGSGFPEESVGLLRSWQQWGEVDHATISYGQGLNVTPVQLTRALAAIANGGRLVEPRLVAARRRPSEPWQSIPPRSARRVLEPEIAASALQMLEQVVSHNGTGRRAGLRGLRVAGKTGTAQKWDQETGRYSNSRFVAWFMGVVPADHPRLAIVVALDEPQRPRHTGGSAAAPVFAKVAAAQLSRMGIETTPQIPLRVVRTTPKPTQDATRVTTRLSKSARPVLPILERLGDSVLLPDLTGLSADEVTQVTANSTLRVEISGQGTVVSQEPAPGTVVHRGHRALRLHLSETQTKKEG
ncbi:transpeptidase family protein [Myxococcota bacterium]|nr:transpeptidase family protein [Myxococcota bacterium]